MTNDCNNVNFINFAEISIIIKLKYKFRAARFSVFRPRTSGPGRIKFITFCFCRLQIFHFQKQLTKQNRTIAACCTLISGANRYCQGPNRNSQPVGWGRPQIYELTTQLQIFRGAWSGEWELQNREPRIICWQCTFRSPRRANYNLTASSSSSRLLITWLNCSRLMCFRFLIKLRAQSPRGALSSEL